MNKKKIAKKIGERLKSARKSSGLSQKELASSLKISDKAVSSYEVGRTTPSYSQLKKISRVVNKPFAYFDVENDTEDLDLQIQLKTIEKELLEIRKELKKRGK